MVYVDRLVNWGVMIGRCGPEWCHMVADSVGELHYFANRLGLKLEWFQNEDVPHYDLTKGKRAQAVRLGAIESDHKCQILFRKYRKQACLAKVTEALKSMTKEQYAAKIGEPVEWLEERIKQWSSSTDSDE